MSEQAATPSSSSTQHQNHQADALLCSPPVSTAAHFPRQFWKAGEYKVNAQASINSMLKPLPLLIITKIKEENPVFSSFSVGSYR
jgi:hypothetical protein